MNNLIDRILETLEEVLELDPQNIERGNELGKEIDEILPEIEKLILKDERKKKYIKIVARLKNRSSKLSRDLINSNKVSLSSDWKQFARQEFSKLRDEALALQEFLTNHESILRKRLNEERYGIDLRDLARRIEKENRLDKVTRSKFSSLIKKMDSEEIQRKSDELKDRLNRISKWLLALTEIKTEAKNAERKI